MESTVNNPVTKFRDSKALRISRQIIPRVIKDETKLFFRIILTVKNSAKYSGIKNAKS